ncbi:MAG TPA: ATP-binding protein [Anaeromyxobacteraceae bacterium]|nr:ATP-binding protein [Anaeromyxobacteraceae bacterium]
MIDAGPGAAAGYATALLNILEDFSADKQQLADTQKAMLNILEDLDAEKGKVEAANRELTRSNAELEQFAYVASHDLQEPLRMVSSYSQLLQQRYEDQLDDRARKYIHYAVDGANRMQRLIQDLLSYSRVGSRGETMVATDSHSALGEAIRNLSAVIEKSQALVTNDDLPRVLAHRSQLVQLFQNLIGNAIKFHGPQAPRVHVAARRERGRWAFAVRDNGIGIEPQHFQRIFLIFQRLHSREQYAGTGIGLALCKRIVERHGGQIWVESQPGEGSAFFFTLRTA